jgi:hypothetical protein
MLPGMYHGSGDMFDIKTDVLPGVMVLNSNARAQPRQDAGVPRSGRRNTGGAELCR